MSSPYQIEKWYWTVADSSPGTQVFSSASGSFVSTSDPTYTAWLSEMGGNQPTPIATLAALYGNVFNSFNQTLQRSSYQASSISADLTLTNPLASFIVVTPSADNLKIIFPQANKPGSLALGQTIRIRNGATVGARPLLFRYNDGTTAVFSGSLVGGEEILFTATANNTTNGALAIAQYVTANISTNRVLGNLSISAANPSLYLTKQASGEVSGLYGFLSVAGVATLRWQLALGDTVAEGGSNSGSNLAIIRYSDAGASLGTPFSINRATGYVTIPALVGSATNDNAAAGNIGESIESSIPNASKVSLTTGTPANVTSISLTAGDWDVSGMVQFDGGGTTTLTALQAGINTVSASLGFTQGRYAALPLAGNAGGLAYLPTLTMMPTRFSLAATTTIYLVAQATFGASTCQAYGRISARRMR